MRRQKERKPTSRAGDPATEALGTFRVLLAELDRVTLDQQRRIESVYSKAALLVTGSAVVAGLMDTSRALAFVLVVTMALAATILGVIAMWPVKVAGISPGGLRDRLAPTGGAALAEQVAVLTIFDARSRLLAESERRLASRARVLRAGFIVLAASLLPVVVASAVEFAVVVIERCWK